MSSKVSAEEIHRLVAQVQGQKRETQPWVPDLFTNSEPANPPEESINTSHVSPHGQQYWSWRKASLSSESSGYTRWSGDDAVSNAPSESTDFTVPTIASNEGIETAHPICCEFWQYNNCTRTFRSIPAFVEHCLTHHPRPLPTTSVCLHCDDWIFHTPVDTAESRQLYFTGRLWHIAEHYLDGFPGPFRPDHFVLNHLHSNQTIDAQTYSVLNINESRNLARLMRGLKKSPSCHEKYFEYVAGPNGRARREAREAREARQHRRH